MSHHVTFTGLDLRLRRVFRPDGRSLVVPIDHATTAGPIGGLAHPGEIVARAAAAGADAVMLRPGLVRALDVPGAERLGVIMALTGRLTQGVDHVLLNTVESALAAGADAVCGEFKFGSPGDLENAAVISRLAERAHAVGLPVLVTVYAQRRILDELGPPAYAHACRIAEEIGADFIKTSLPDDEEVFRACVDVVSVPVLVAGGAARSITDVADFLRRATACGLAGGAVGRNAFMGDRPEDAVRQLLAAVHGPADAAAAAIR